MDERGEKREDQKLSFVDGCQTVLVQDLADAPPPPRFIQVESKRPAQDLPHHDIPVVDLSCCLSQTEEGDKLRSALQTWGLFQAVGHGLPSSLLDEVRTMGKLFFHQPLQEKQKYMMRDGIEGYGNDKIHSEDQILDWRDQLCMKLHPKQERKMELWPETPISFRETLDEYFKKTQAMVDVILKACAKLLGLAEDSFTGRMGDADVYASFNLYPPCSKPELVLGIKPHADASAVTVLLQDPDVEGLQVLNHGLGWVNVPIVLDALLVNLGDQLEIMSNGEYLSPMHRVATNSERERISVAMFHLAGSGEEIGPASGLLAEGKPRLYKNVNSKEYLEQGFKNFYNHGDRAIHSAKV